LSAARASPSMPLAWSAVWYHCALHAELCSATLKSLSPEDIDILFQLCWLEQHFLSPLLYAIGHTASEFVV